MSDTTGKLLSIKKVNSGVERGICRLSLTAEKSGNKKRNYTIGSMLYFKRGVFFMKDFNSYNNELQSCGGGEEKKQNGSASADCTDFKEDISSGDSGTAPAGLSPDKDNSKTAGIIILILLIIMLIYICYVK